MAHEGSTNSNTFPAPQRSSVGLRELHDSVVLNSPRTAAHAGKLIACTGREKNAVALTWRTGGGAFWSEFPRI